MNFTKEWYESYLARQNAKAKGNRARTELQKQQNADHETQAQADHKTRKAKVDGPGHQKFEIGLEIRISDRRRRDLTGAAETIMDCLVHAGIIADDNWEVVPLFRYIRGVRVPKGEEGADIHIFPIRNIT